MPDHPHANSKFKQQRLPACRPFLTPLGASIIYLCIGVIALVFGLVHFFLSKSLKEYEFQYDDNCTVLGKPCTLIIDISEDIKTPIYLYYQLTNVYQNNFMYSSSKSWDQIQGKFADLSDVKSDCSPIYLRDENNKTVSNIRVPCGSVAASVFNDTFQFESHFPQVYQDDITLTSFKKIFKDYNKKYENSYLWLQEEPYASLFPNGQSNLHFINWFQLAAFPKFRKLWGIVKDDIKKGQYTVKIQNNFNVTSFDGTKSLVLAQAGSIGGKNIFFGIFFIAIAAVSFLAAIIFFLLRIFNVLPLYKAFIKSGGQIEMNLVS